MASKDSLYFALTGDFPQHLEANRVEGHFCRISVQIRLARISAHAQVCHFVILLNHFPQALPHASHASPERIGVELERRPHRTPQAICVIAFFQAELG
jgi:hypothetical protein